jgi:hypothetical protein
VEEMRFEVRHPDGRSERLVVQTARAMIGTGAHCDVRLAGDQASTEHVHVELTPSGIRLSSVASTPPALLDGAPLAVAEVPQWGILDIGATKIHLARATVATAKSGKKLGSRAIARIGGLVVLALGAGYLFVHDDDESKLMQAVTAPELFSPAAVACPRTDPGEATVVADDQRAVADAARERSPFAPRDAVVAVKAYDIAAACYRTARADAAAAEAMASSKELRDTTWVDFRARRVRLERSLAVNDYELASTDVAILKTLSEGRSGLFSAWLTKVEHQIRFNEGVRAP